MPSGSGIRPPDAPGGGPGWPLAGAALALAAYMALSYVLMLRWPDRPWSVAVLFGPLALALLAGAWQRRHVGGMAAALGGIALLALVVASGGVTDIQRLYVLQHAALHLVLAGSFAITLKAGSTPLITALARRLHRRFTPAMAAYTRALTAAWVAYFLGMVVVSVALYALAPWGVWSLFCNVLTPLAALGFFLGELAWRRWRHPEFEPVSALAAWQAYRHHGRPGAAAGAAGTATAAGAVATAAGAAPATAPLQAAPAAAEDPR